jgi:NADH dehydrogenase/NADH:ubiquinone oxidoreductase subunit G
MQKKVKSFWFNTHSSQIAFRNNVILPITSLLENEGTYLNLEGRPQKTFKTSAKINERLGVRSTNLIFRAIRIDYFQSKFLSYIGEIVKTPKYFSLMENTFVHLKSKRSFLAHLISVVSFYPIKPSIEDFYTKGLFCKKSSTMLKCSQNARKDAINFQ